MSQGKTGLGEGRGEGWEWRRQFVSRQGTFKLHTGVVCTPVSMTEIYLLDSVPF